jgi:hypothetical protein
MKITWNDISTGGVPSSIIDNLMYLTCEANDKHEYPSHDDRIPDCIIFELEHTNYKKVLDKLYER